MAGLTRELARQLRDVPAAALDVGREASVKWRAQAYYRRKPSSYPVDLESIPCDLLVRLDARAARQEALRRETVGAKPSCSSS